jgi:hypothetical protein
MPACVAHDRRPVNHRVRGIPWYGKPEETPEERSRASPAVALRGRSGSQEARNLRASSRPFSLSCGPLMPVRLFSVMRQAK